MIILDFGSGNTCKNDREIIKKMIDGLDILSYEFKKRIIIKWQLFEEAGDNVHLCRSSFDFAFAYGRAMGYKTTASVFDKDSLLRLLAITEFDIPFVKIANSKELYYLGDYVPRGIDIIQSVGESAPHTLNYTFEDFQRAEKNVNIEDIKITTGGLNRIELTDLPPQGSLCCVSKYPAGVIEYKEVFTEKELCQGISDHTTNWDLYKKYKPEIYECHYKLEDSTGLDAGEFARTPAQLLELDKYLQEK